MFKTNSVLIISIFFITSICFSAVNTENRKLIEELTGRSVDKTTIGSVSVAAKHLQAGMRALKNGNYILALKYYNTVILKHSKSKEVVAAYLAKAKLYSEMGLAEQAELNSKYASRYGNKTTK